MEILRIKVVQRRTGLGRSTIYDRISKGTFPRQISLGARAVGWIDSEIDQWVNVQISHSRGESTGTASIGRIVEGQSEDSNEDLR